MSQEVSPGTTASCYWGHTTDRAQLRLCRDGRNYVCPRCCHETCKEKYPAMFEACASEGWPVWPPSAHDPTGEATTEPRRVPLVTVDAVAAPTPDAGSFGDRRARKLAWLSLALGVPLFLAGLSIGYALAGPDRLFGQNPVANGETCTVSGTAEFGLPDREGKRPRLTADEFKALANEVVPSAADVRVEGLDGVVASPGEVTLEPKAQWPGYYELRGTWRLTPPAGCPQGRHEIRLVFPALVRHLKDINASTDGVTIKQEIFTYPTPQARLFYPVATWSAVLILGLVMFVTTACVVYGYFSDWFGELEGLGFRLIIRLSAVVFLGTGLFAVGAGGVLTEHATDAVGYLWQTAPAIALAVCTATNLFVVAGVRLLTGEFRWSTAWEVVAAPIVGVGGGLTAALWVAYACGYDVFWRMQFSLTAATIVPGAALACVIAGARARPAPDAGV